MNDLLQINALSISTHIGVYAWEQRILQQLLFDISIPVDIKHCDNQLVNTIDYATLCDQVTAFVESKAFTLIETVAEEVALLIKTQFQVKQLTLTVCKPHAIKNAAKVCISVTR